MATTWEGPGAVMSTPGQASRQTSHALRKFYDEEGALVLGPEVSVPFQEYLPRRIVQYHRGYLTARDLEASDWKTLVLNDGQWPAPQAWPLVDEGPVGFESEAVTLQGGLTALVAGVAFGLGLFTAWSATWAPVVAAGLTR
jgi:hypothetical protein